MAKRTDLAVELNADKPQREGITVKEEKEGILTVTHIEVLNKEGEKSLGRKKGKYISIDIPDLLYHGRDYEELEKIIISSLNEFNIDRSNILVAGLGNSKITADALGPATAEKILATRHLSRELLIKTGMGELNKVSVILPGVLGQTGIETVEILKGVTATCTASCLIVIDAFAAADPKRLGTTIQLTDSGISPGSGVGNDRKEISSSTLGIPVISIGVPTCVDASLLGPPLEEKRKCSMIVTPKEIDLLIEKASEILSLSINCFLQPMQDRDLLLSIV